MTDLMVRQTELDTETLGAIFVRSGFFADTREQSQAIVKILAGRELGFGPIASMQGVYMVNSRVTLSANLIGAAIKRSGRYDYRVIKLQDDVCELAFFEQGEKVGVSTFSLEDARKAGLTGDRGNYGKYPRNMLFARALTNGARWYCPDVFNGAIYTPEELGARVDYETGEVLALPDGGPSRTASPSAASAPVTTAPTPARAAQTPTVVSDQRSPAPAFVPTTARDVEDADLVRTEDDADWLRWIDMVMIAEGHDVPVPMMKLGVTREALRAAGVKLADEVTRIRRERRTAVA